MLYLDGLGAIGPAVAAALARHAGTLLSFARIATLSDEEAAALSGYAGVLSLTGLTTLSEATARIFAARPAKVVLTGLKNASPAVRAILEKKA